MYPNAPDLQIDGLAIPPAGPRLRIIATNDFHGALEPRADANGVQRGGAAHVATMIEKARTECAPCETILVDGGDLSQGTLASNLSYGRHVVDYYNRMGYVATALGNHDLDWGQDTLRARMRQAKFPFLAANVRTPDGRDVTWIPNDTIVIRGNTRVGIIGVAGVATARSSFPKNIAGLRFDAAAPVIDSHARSLRRRGADVVVVLTHDGGFCNSTGSGACRGEVFDIASKLTEKVDAIIGGHTHTLIDYDSTGVPIVQARSRGQAIAIVDIPLKDGKPVGPGYGEVRSVVATDVAAHPGVDSIVKRAAASVASLVNRPIARLAEAMPRTGNQYALGNLIADAARVIGRADIGMMNNGGIRAGLPAGTVTYGQLFEVHPFGNRLYRVRMSGAQLRTYLEQVVARDNLREHVSGITIGYNPELPKGQRITQLRLPDGRTLADAAMYTVAMNEFMAVGGGEGVEVPEGATVTPLEQLDVDVLIAYLRSLPAPVRAPTEHRIVITQ